MANIGCIFILRLIIIFKIPYSYLDLIVHLILKPYWLVHLGMRHIKTSLVCQVSY